jgi:hypothetical protein
MTIPEVSRNDCDERQTKRSQLLRNSVADKTPGRDETRFAIDTKGMSL